MGLVSISEYHAVITVWGLIRFALKETAKDDTMAHKDELKSTQTSAPDLGILGDQLTLHPSGYTESTKSRNEGSERALMAHSARFRKSPLEYADTTLLYNHELTCILGFSARSLSMSPGLAGVHMKPQLDSPFSILVSAKI